MGEGQVAAAARAGNGASLIKSVDQLFEHLGHQVPGGFGGLIYDETGNLVMLLKDMSQRSAALDALIAAQTKPVDDPAALRASISVQEATYSFNELQSWRKMARRMDLPNVASFDVAEDLNKVRIGVFGPIGPVRAALIDAGVPRTHCSFSSMVEMRRAEGLCTHL